MGRHYEKKSYYKLPISNPCRLFILIVMLMVLFLTYFYNIMGVAKDNTLQEVNEINKMQYNATPNTTKAKSASKIVTKNKNINSQKPLSSVKSNGDKLPEDKELFEASSEERMESSTKETSRQVSHSNSDVDCRMFLCFNYTRCPLTGMFPIYVYNLDKLYNGIKEVTAPIKEMLNDNNYITSNPAEACIFLVITELPFRGKNKSKGSYKMVNEMVLDTLPHWGRDGQNHVLLNLGHSKLAAGTGSAIVAQSMFTHEQFRPGFDVVIPPAHGPIKGEVWYLSPPISTAKRQHFLSFQGQRSSVMGSNSERDSLVKILKHMKWSDIPDLYLRFNCKTVHRLTEKRIDDWPLCENHKSRTEKLSKSTFVLIIALGTYIYASTNLLQTRLYEALESGAIPVILGGDRIRLPYEEVLDWRKAVIRLPMVRVSELIFLLENITEEDILAFRKHGRMLWERYLGSVQASVDTLLAVIRIRLNIPPRPAESTSPYIYDFLGYEKEGKKSYKIFAKTTSMEITAFNVAKKPLTTYKRNFTVGFLNGYELWNSWGDPFTLYPELPWDPILPPEARLLNSSVSKHYLEVCSMLAEDAPKENFTIVILTYNRKITLNKTISRLSRLPHLHKSVDIVVCNGPKPSTEGWPTDVPIALVQASYNSLNSRFLPYDLIETEAVFSVDDDALPPNVEEIVFAFKVWCEHRDQIVGSYGRNFEWNNGFVYKTLYKSPYRRALTICEVSILLTGAAFIHRYYFWAYWRQLPDFVRHFVDKHQNCEDIAMNFLVAHITRKAPIMVTSGWKENDTTVPFTTKLSHYRSHFQGRHICINLFSKIMGYNPLLHTHYHVESFASVKTFRE